MNIGPRMKVAIVAGIAVSAGLFEFGGSGFAAQETATWTLSVNPLRSPAASNTGEPQLTVSSRGVLLSWVEHAGSTTTLRFAERTATGWTEPRTVASGQDWSINPIDVPSVLRLSNGTLVGQWLQRAGTSMHTNDVRLSYSKDDGRTWAPPFTPYRDTTQHERLFAFPFEMPDGALGVVWLDGRPMPPDTASAGRAGQNHAPGGADHGRPPGTGHQDHQGGAQHGAPANMGDMSLRFAAFDNAWKQTGDTPIDQRVCECCSTAAVVTSEGVVAAYRNRSDDEVRDIYVSRLEQGRWTEGSVVHAENWRIPMCPINGPALSATGRDVVIAWYTAKQDDAHAYLGFSRDAGRTFGQPIRLDDRTSLGRVDVELLPDGSAIASWIEFDDGRAQFRVRRVTRDGARSGAVTVAGLGSGGRASGTPRIVRHGDELLFAWTESNDGGRQVRTAVVRLPRHVTR